MRIPLLTLAFAAIGVLATSGLSKAQLSILRPESNLLQLMRSVFFDNSNVVFFAQLNDPANVRSAPEISMATDPLMGSFGKWEAVENSSLAIAESANLLMIPGRKCGNGRDVPVTNADWPRLVDELRDAGQAAYKAAQTKDQDKVREASDQLTAACADCHRKYRPRALADRCK